MSFLGGMGKLAMGLGCIVCAPFVVGGVAYAAASAGAVAITAGVASEASVIATGLTAMTVAETATVTAGKAIAARGAIEAGNI